MKVPERIGIIEVLHRIEKMLAAQLTSYVFRGEPACFEKISSGLYRNYELKKDQGSFDFAIEGVENELVEKARSFTDRNDKFDILCEIQHRGGKTNQIDFTRDLGVALFFACGTEAGRSGEPGRVIMLDTDSSENYGVYVRDVTHPLHMAAAQKSVFVCTNSGYLDSQHLPFVHIWTIDASEKQTLLDYLKRARGLDSRTLFMDISGFIRHEDQFENANAWLSRARDMLSGNDFDKAIHSASRYLELAGDGWEANPGLYIRGLAHFERGSLEYAFRDLRRIQNVRRTQNRRNFFGRIERHVSEAYPLPDHIKKPLNEWIARQEKIEAASKAENEHSQRRENMVLQFIMDIVSKNPAQLIFNLFTDTGYAYSQIFSMESGPIRVSVPVYFLDRDSVCWWSFYGPSHQHVTSTCQSIPEDFEIDVPHKSGGPSCKVRIRFYAQDVVKQELKKTDSGGFVVVDKPDRDLA